MMMMLLVVTTTACSDDEPNGNSFTSEEKSALKSLSGTWVCDDALSSTITFSPYSAPKEVAGAGALSSIKLTFHGTYSYSYTYGGIKVTNSYYFVVKPGSKKIEAYGVASDGGYSVDTKNYTYKVSSSELVLDDGTAKTFTKK